MNWGIFGLVLVAVLAALLLMAGLEDVRRREIANWKNAAVALLAPVWWWWSGYSLWPEVAAQVGLALAVFALFALAFRFGWMGGGDVKLIAALALWLPLVPLVQLLAVMSIVGGVLTVVMMIDHRRRRAGGPVETPYGVAIAIAALVALPGNAILTN